MKITADNVRQFVDYDPESGCFIWRERTVRRGMKLTDEGWNTRFAGKPVAERRHRHGHLQIQLFGKNYMAHRLAWMWFYRAAPSGGLDHINGNPSDNRIVNLRLATPSQNMMNSKIRVNNTSGVKGVSWSRRDCKWYAYISRDQRMLSLGRFSDFGAAVIARKSAEAALHGEFARAP